VPRTLLTTWLLALEVLVLVDAKLCCAWLSALQNSNSGTEYITT
jgi:hypothetical protein